MVKQMGKPTDAKTENTIHNNHSSMLSQKISTSRAYRKPIPLTWLPLTAFDSKRKAYMEDILYGLFATKQNKLFFD